MKTLKRLMKAIAKVVISSVVSIMILAPITIVITAGISWCYFKLGVNLIPLVPFGFVIILMVIIEFNTDCEV